MAEQPGAPLGFMDGGAIGVALFGARVGVGGERIVSGLHETAWISAALLIAAAIVAWHGLRRRAEHASADALA